jgi:hypothetical protein
MTRSMIPTVCTLALACMAAAVASHWWSVRQWVANAPPPGAPAPQVVGEIVRTDAQPPTPKPPAIPAETPPADAAPLATGGHVGMPQQEFYQELLREMRLLRGENQNLRNQLEETNRDLMKLEFRVDTHSEQFRPLPVMENHFNSSFDNTFDSDPEQFPLRAEPVLLPSIE